MASNTYSYGSLGERWTVGDPTSKDRLDTSRVKNDANRWTLEALLTDPDTSLFTLVNGTLATTQSASDNSTKIATTAYVDASSTSPGGSNTQVQYNNSGAFGGSANLTFDGSTLKSTAASAVAPLYAVQPGSAGGNTYAIQIDNSTTATAGTASSIHWRLHNGSDYANAGRVLVGAETAWASADDDSFMAFHTADAGSIAEKMRITAAGKVGIANTAPDTYVGSISAGLVVGDTGDSEAAVHIASSTTGYGILAFTDTADTNTRGGMNYFHNLGGKVDELRFLTAGDDRMVIDSAGLVFIGDTANAFQTVGLTINTGGNDGEALSIKSTDVSHPFTGHGEADTYFCVRKWSSNDGGAYDMGFSETNIARAMGARSGTDDTTDTTSSGGCFWIGSSLTDGGTAWTANGATANIWTLNNNGTTRVIFKGDGTVHASDTSWATGLDDIPDALAGRAYTTEMAYRQGDGLLAGMEINAPELVQRMEDAGIVTHAELEGEGVIPGHRFLNLQKSVKFSWDMGFQNFSFLAEIAKVLSDEQRSALPSQMQDAFALLETNRMEIN